MAERDLPNGRDVSVRVALVGGSPLLIVDGAPVAWYENWIPVDPAPAMTARELSAIQARLRA